MGVERWMTRQEMTEEEQHMLLRMKRTWKLVAFLRRHRHELFDEAFQEELEAMYRQTGAGKAPVPPGLSCLPWAPVVPQAGPTKFPLPSEPAAATQ